jgi:hypothetical protein
MTRTFSTFVLAILRAGALGCVVLFVLRPRFSAKSGDRESHHSIRVLGGRPPVSGWGLCFRQRSPRFSFDPPRRNKLRYWGLNHPLCRSARKEKTRVIFVLRDGKCSLFELWSVQGRYVVTAEFEHRGEVSEQQRQVPLTIVE